MTFIHTQSSVQPEPIDATSSKGSVYIRKNIEEKEREDLSGNTYTIWEYDEAKVSHEEFASYSAALQLANQEAMDETLAEILLKQV